MGARGVDRKGEQLRGSNEEKDEGRGAFDEALEARGVSRAVSPLEGCGCFPTACPHPPLAR